HLKLTETERQARGGGFGLGRLDVLQRPNVGGGSGIAGVGEALREESGLHRAFRRLRLSRECLDRRHQFTGEILRVSLGPNALRGVREATGSRSVSWVCQISISGKTAPRVATIVEMVHSSTS